MCLFSAQMHNQQQETPASPDVQQPQLSTGNIDDRAQFLGLYDTVAVRSDDASAKSTLSIDAMDIFDGL
jgi:hypothetical protein